MTDSKLVELVARALWSGDSCGFDDFYIGKARAALAAINASGTHWVAPIDLSTDEAMWATLRQCATGKREEWDEFTDFSGDAGNWNWLWHELRAAHLAEPKA